MKLRSLLYTSASTLNSATAADEVKALVALAAARNRAHGVTGALFFTGDRFTQVIEGTREGTEAVFRIVQAATAHKDIVVLQDVEIESRRFNDWNMAYAGSSVFVEREIDRALAQAEAGATPDVIKLLSLFQAFAKSG